MSSTFILNSTTLNNLAKGVSFGPDGKYVPADVEPMLEFNDPAGSLFASHDDMANLVAFLFREVKKILKSLELHWGL